MVNAYINGAAVNFTGDVMEVTFFSTTKISCAVVNRKKNRYSYTFTYSPAAKSAVNGVVATAIAKEDLPFLTSLIGGVKLANVYTEMKSKYAAFQARRPRRTDSKCTCGRCFDCVAQ